MNYVSVESVSKSFTERMLLHNLTFGLNQGQKTALVGINGSGKSTLMKIIAGLEFPDEGKVVLNSQLNLSYLDQNPDLNEEDTVLEAVFNASGNEVLSLIKTYEKTLDEVEKTGIQSELLNDLIQKMDNVNAWDYESQVKQILGKLDILQYDQKISSLSGGQKKRVALANALVKKPDFLILDEPTNHLDIEMIEWLEQYLMNQPITLLLVTHDRYFLDNVTNDILELDNGTIQRYQGNYRYFLEKKSEADAIKQAETAKNHQFLKKELEWIRRQPKARGTKAKYRIDAFNELKDKTHQISEQQGMVLNVEARRQGKSILSIKNLNHGYGDISLIEDFSYTFKKGDKIGIIGKNGIGKSTLLDIITGAIAPLKGIVDKGQTTEFGYYTQSNQQLDPNLRVIETVTAIGEFIQLIDGNQLTASQLLNLFLFPPKAQYNLVGNLSGGEKRRLQLMRVLIKNPNFLILDEPTNDFDLDTLNVLESFLLNFPGCLVLVSHDRYFMDKLVNHIFVFEGNGKISDFPGNFTDYQRNRLENEVTSAPKKQKSSNQPTPRKSTEKIKLTFNELREYESLTKEIDKLEEEKKMIIVQMNSGGLDHEDLRITGEKIIELDKLIGAKTDRWLYLSEFV